ncbi:IS66-like element accessory protein TnpA [Actibacterium sp. D379-3]
MARLSEAKRNELEAFWRAHIQGWRDSTLNQREYCEAHGLPLKRFGNWRAKFRHEDPQLTGKLLYRRGEGSEHMLTHMRSAAETPYIPSGRPGENGRRRNFGVADKRRIVEEASSPGASVSGVAKKYGIGARLLFQWKKDLMPDPRSEPVFAEVKLEGAAAPAAMASSPLAPPIVVERAAPGIEVSLKGGRRVRFDRETDPEVIRRLVVLLEGAER